MNRNSECRFFTTVGMCWPAGLVISLVTYSCLVCFMAVNAGWSVISSASYCISYSISLIRTSELYLFQLYVITGYI